MYVNSSPIPCPLASTIHQPYQKLHRQFHSGLRSEYDRDAVHDALPIDKEYSQPEFQTHPVQIPHPGSYLISLRPCLLDLTGLLTSARFRSNVSFNQSIAGSLDSLALLRRPHPPYSTANYHPCTYPIFEIVTRLSPEPVPCLTTDHALEGHAI